MKKKGISLVALVVTIIVLIILTGTVIATFMEGGIIDKAKQAVMLSDYTTLVEAYNVAYNTAKIDEATGTGEKVNKIGILEKVVNELGLKGFSFQENEVKYEGENTKIADWVKSEFELAALTDLGYIFSTINGVTYMTGLSGEEDMMTYAIAAEQISNLEGYSLEGETIGINIDVNEDGIIEESFITNGTKLLKNGNIVATIIVKGQVCADFDIDGYDTVILGEMLDGTKTDATDIELLAADINNDGFVSEEDLNEILKYFGRIFMNENQKVKLTQIPTVVIKEA